MLLSGAGLPSPRKGIGLIYFSENSLAARFGIQCSAKLFRKQPLQIAGAGEYATLAIQYKEHDHGRIRSWWSEAAIQ
jgi:hypothetical protein